jgi:hypothetical protein
MPFSACADRSDIPNFSYAKIGRMEEEIAYPEAA